MTTGTDRKTLNTMTAEVRKVVEEKGWRDGTNTWGDYVALLHSEIAEMLEAYRDHLLEDATTTGCMACTLSGVGACDDAPHVFKPEGVGSEAADVLIRLLDMADVADAHPWLDSDTLSYMRVTPEGAETFGDHMDFLHWRAAKLSPQEGMTSPQVREALLRHFLRALVGVCAVYGIDLDAEYERKLAYNRTRAFRHGGRVL